MAAPLLDAPSRTAMSWPEYVALGDDAPGEYYDGHLMLAPSPDQKHQLVCVDLVILLRATVPEGYRVDTGWQWSPADGQSFIPDVMVYPSTTESTKLTETPVLAVAVLSRNRSDDLVVKTTRYAAAGLDHYWVVDRAAGELRVYELHGSVYEQTQVIGSDPADVNIGIATVRTDMTSLLA